MIIWLTGNSGAGKTALARKLKTDRTIILDGDEMRNATGQWGFDEVSRRRHCSQIANIAKLLEAQGFQIIVAVICPYQDLRDQIQKETGAEFIYLEMMGDDQIEDKPYERPTKGIKVVR